jgi:hypothetical protein
MQAVAGVSRGQLPFIIHICVVRDRVGPITSLGT